MDTLWLPRPYRSLNWERLAQHSEPCHTNLCSSRALQALESFTPIIKSSTLETATIAVPLPGHMKTREVQGKLPSSGGQETALPPGLTIVLSFLSMQHAPIDISPNSITIHSSSHSSHPSARLTSPLPACEALAMAHLERTLALVRSAMAEATPSSSFITQVTQPFKESAHIMGNK